MYQTIELYAGCVRTLSICMVEPVCRKGTMIAMDHLASYKPISMLFERLKTVSLEVDDPKDLTYCLNLLPRSLKELVIKFHYTWAPDDEWEVALKNLYDFLEESTTLTKLWFEGVLPISGPNRPGLHRALRRLTRVKTLCIGHPMLDGVGLGIIASSPQLKYLQMTSIPLLQEVCDLIEEKSPFGRFAALTGLTISTSVKRAARLLSALTSDLRLLVLAGSTRGGGLDAELDELSYAISLTSPNIRTLDLNLDWYGVVDESSMDAGLDLRLSFNSLKRLKDCHGLQSFHFTSLLPAPFAFDADDFKWMRENWSMLRSLSCLWVQDQEFEGAFGVGSEYDITLEEICLLASDLKHLVSVCLPFVTICKPTSEKAMEHHLSSLLIYGDHSNLTSRKASGGLGQGRRRTWEATGLKEEVGTLQRAKYG
ncbi:hypothetical protein CALCODRAFT_507256 [Calocera cornea HHB12733]|uniref:F-box domain-containing protein n=1 Tax=Calocera cornea HHB12733 TaxID=1353952 RepID=A0A165HYD3_9BASI|nr:hypothetical protein CALCODRAFT_507256 [Calocera cornea HHB12733]